MSKRAFAFFLVLIILAAWLISGVTVAYAQDDNLLQNGGFEDGLGPDITDCAVYDLDGQFVEWRNPDEIVVPPGWRCAFIEGPEGQPGQPEARAIPRLPPYLDPPRIYAGNWAFQAFTFYRTHHVCLWQPVATEPGQQYAAQAAVHNWCATTENDDPHVSDCDVGSITQTIRIFNTSPFSPDLEMAVEIYDHYDRMTLFFTAAQTETNVAFCSQARWAVRNNDFYLDSAGVYSTTFPYPQPEHFAYLPKVASERDDSTKLGLHVIRQADGFWPFVEACPAAIKFVGDHGQSRHLPACVEYVVGAVYLPYDAQGLYNWGLAPQTAAALTVDDMWPTISSNPAIDYWEVQNEPVLFSDDFRGWFVIYSIHAMMEMEARGKRAVIGNFSTGCPELDDWPHLLPMLEYARDNGHLLGLHEYSNVFLWHEAEWLTLRHRKVYNDYLIPAGLGDLPLLIGEAGVDPLVGFVPPGYTPCAYRDCCAQWCSLYGQCDCARFYADQWIWYDGELRRDPYVVGVAGFTIGAWEHSPWFAFDMRGECIGWLAEYLEGE